MKRAHRGKDKYKVNFELQIKKVTNLKDHNGSSIYIAWRRGSKKTSGDTKRVIVDKNEASWEQQEKISFDSKLFMDPKSQKFDEKKLSLTLKEDNKKKGKVELAKVSIDLSNFANSNGSEGITIPFVKGAPSRGPCLLVTIKTRPLKYNDKTLVKVSSSSHPPERDSRLVKTIAGEDYYLDRTASEPSPTTLDTQSVASDNDDDDVFDAADIEKHHDAYSVSSGGGGGGGNNNGNTNNGPSNNMVVDELRRRIEDLSQQLEESDSESFSRLATIREKDKEISNLQKEITKLRKDKDELVDQLERLKKPAGKSDVDTLRAEAVERLSTINSLEKEIDKLKKELSAKDKENSNREPGGMNNASELAALKSRATSLQQDNDRLSKLLREKEKEKDSSQTNGKGSYEDTSRGSSIGGSSRGTNVVLSRDGRDDDLRKQLTSLKQEMDDKILLEKSVYCVEPQFRAGLSISASLILDVLPAGAKDKDKDKSLGHTLSSLMTGLETAVKRTHSDNAMLCYWMSTSFSILLKLRKKQEQDYDAHSPTILASSSSTSPLTRFEYALTALASKIYSQLVKNAIGRLEEELVGVLLHSHHMPRGTPLASGAGLVLSVINGLHATLLDYHVPSNVAFQLFTQLYYYINAVLFNCMLSPGPSKEDLCTCNSGFRIRLQLSRLEEWVPSSSTTPSSFTSPSSIHHLPSSSSSSNSTTNNTTTTSSSLLTSPQLASLREQLAPAVQAAKLLVIDKKLLTDHEVFEQLCPVLSVAQVRRILTNYTPDALSPEPIPSTISQTLDLLEKKERDKGGGTQSFEFDTSAVRPLSLSFLSEK